MDPEYTGRVTVPVLWDDQEKRIINNESSEIVKMLDKLPSEAPSLRPDGVATFLHTFLMS